MRLIYAQGFSKSEKEEWRAIIFNNILSAFKVVLDAMDDLDIPFGDQSNDVSRELFMCPTTKNGLLANSRSVPLAIHPARSGRLRLGTERSFTKGIPDTIQKLVVGRWYSTGH